MTSPIDGKLLEEDWTQKLGSPVQLGEVLFAVAPLKNCGPSCTSARTRSATWWMRCEGYGTRPARSKATCDRGPAARRFASSSSGSIPVAEVKDQKNVFRVRVVLAGIDVRNVQAWMLPDAQGVAKIDIDQRQLRLDLDAQAGQLGAYAALVVLEQQASRILECESRDNLADVAALANECRSLPCDVRATPLGSGTGACDAERTVRLPVDRPTFSESWYRVADLRPRLRSTVQVHRQHFRGQMWHVIQDPANNQFFRLNEAAYRFVALLDGRRTVAEVWRCLQRRSSATTPRRRARPSSFSASSTPPTCSRPNCRPTPRACSSATASACSREVQGYLMNLLFIRIPLLDPDRFLNRWVGVFGQALHLVRLRAVAGADVHRRCFTWSGNWSDLCQPAPQNVLDSSQPAAAVRELRAHQGLARVRARLRLQEVRRRTAAAAKCTSWA